MTLNWPSLLEVQGLPPRATQPKAPGLPTLNTEVLCSPLLNEKKSEFSGHTWLRMPAAEHCDLGDMTLDLEAGALCPILLLTFITLILIL